MSDANDSTTPIPEPTPAGTPGEPTRASGAGEEPPAKADAMAEAALKAAQDAIAGLADGYAPPAQGALGDDGAVDEPAPMPVGAKVMDLPKFESKLSADQQRTIDLLSDVHLNVKIELGRTRMLIEDVLKLNEGAVVELDKLAGDPVDIFVNERHIARGEVLVLNDNFCVRISEIMQTVGATTAAVAKPVS